MMNALRLEAGFQWEHYFQRTGLAAETVAPTLSGLQHAGLAVPSAGGWKTTARGWDLLNDVVQRFLVSANSPIAAGS
jgi:coproporphyrinogen III oxidase-like Fe-S oxidoreductase